MHRYSDFTKQEKSITVTKKIFYKFIKNIYLFIMFEIEGNEERGEKKCDRNIINVNIE